MDGRPSVEVTTETGKHLRGITGEKRVVVFSDSPGCTCVGGNDLYDLGFSVEETDKGVELKIDDLVIEIRKSPQQK